MIANLLPGIRELRAPLAAGYIWLFGIWLVVEPHLPAKGHGEDAVTHAVTELGDIATPVAVGVAVTFAAYVIGSLSEALVEFGVRFLEVTVPRGRFVRLRRWAARRVRGLRVGLRVPPVALEVEIPDIGSSAGTEEAMSDTESAIEERRERLAREREALAAERELRRGEIENLQVQLVPVRDKDADAEKRIMDELRQLEGADERLREREETMRAQEDQLEEQAKQARAALEDQPIPERLQKPLRLSGRGHRSIDSLVRERRNQYLPGLTARGISFRDVFGRDIAQRIETAGSVVNGLFAQVVEELDLAASRLIGEQPELFAAIDRPRAEAEFRLGLVAPLVAVAIILTALTDNAAWLLALVLAAALALQGMRRRRAAGDLIADALYLNRMEAPVLERLRRAAGEERAEPERKEPKDEAAATID